MNISNIPGVGNAQAVGQTSEAQRTNQAGGRGRGSALMDALMQDPVDTVTLNDRPGIRGAADADAVRALWTETNEMTDSIRKLLRSILGMQDAGGQGFWARRALGNIEISEADRAHAQELISEDGFFGVEQTTDRIMSFARALVGEDASEEQIERMRAAAQRGFDDVARMFGGFNNLPQVTRDTFNAVMAAFDEWLGRGDAAEQAE